MQVFHTEEQVEVRTVKIDGEPWFVFGDVCRALDYTPQKGSFTKQAEKLDDDEKRYVARDVLKEDLPSVEGGRGAAIAVGESLLCVNESGLFSTILRSDKPSAKRFKKWVTAEVLPSIRRSGAYVAPGAGIPVEWRPFHERIESAWGVVPEGYFSIFREMADLTAQLITQGVPVDHKTIPDISLGIAWGKHWEKGGFDAVFSPRRRYPHDYPASFPQAASNPQHPWCYPEAALPTFRKWLRDDYLKVGLPKYLSGQQAQGKIAGPVARAVLAAVTAKPSVARLTPPA